MRPGNLSSSYLENIAVIGNYLPRHCGVATFITDLCKAIAREYPKTDCFALAVNDTSAGTPTHQACGLN